MDREKEWVNEEIELSGLSDGWMEGVRSSQMSILGDQEGWRCY